MRHAVLGTVLLAAATARAQIPAPSPSPSPLPVASEYVEVTATRIPEQPADVPAALEVVTGEELAARGARDLRGALALAAGVEIAPGGDQGPASSVPEFWGLKEFDAVLLVVDGVPWGGAFNPSLATLDLSDVERIEVLRGAAPVMYGATSFVGVIHVVRKDPAAVRNAITARGGSYASGGASLVARLPSWSGWSSALSLDGERRGFSDQRTLYWRGHGLWRNSRKWGAGRFWLNLDGTLLDQDPASPHPRSGPVLSPLVPLDANHNPADSFLNERRGALSLGFDRPWGKTTWTTTASVSRSSQDVLRGFLSDVGDVGLNARGLGEKLHLTDAYLDSHVAWTADPDVKLVAGLDWLHGNGNADGAAFGYHASLSGDSATAIVLPAVLDVRIEDRRDFAGAYAFAEWNPTARLRLEAGLRLNVTSEEREGEAEAGKPAGEVVPGSDHTRLSGAAGLAWTAWERGADRVRLFASYRDTFKPAAVDFGIGEAEGESEGILEPETARSYELGLKAHGLDGRLSLEVSAFLMDFDNLVVARTVNGLPGLVNAGKERFKGIEAALDWRLRGDWRARMTYSLHDARFRDFVMEFDPGVPTQLAGNRLEMSARRLASLGLLRAPSRGLVARAELSYVGSRFLNKRNTALVDGYATVSAGLGYRNDRWELRLDGENLGDRRDPVAESELGDAQYYRLTARRVDVSVTRRF